ncbi:SDR family NAD(P)-dependent oxidoreductase [Carnobacterium maltaromaticum]|uniref:SDR family NAD(P)-dependent oxidoreductase n=1 Tax=Carnobacterium maltaromaticum TaxID=2751 RepID=UPI00165BD6B3|nr:SDR family NAD(P)-dependent oxidoreductase [Carnobacterium maltaromaticum]MBC9787543.1 glucose 1-dehydrogenase [Carnobacterium maltaromaticum]
MNGKIAVVTGGGSGIGEGICLELARIGAQVIVSDINGEAALEVAKEIEDNGFKAEARTLDVTNASDIKELGDYIKEKYGLIDYWVNSAGISKIIPFFEHTEELWDNTLNINLKGQFLCCKVAIEQMLEKGKGSIINLSSQSGKVGTSSYQAYCSSKFGVIGLTQSLAAEFGPKGIRVNSIAPGVIYTPMWDEQKKDYAKKRNLNPDEVMDYFKAKIPLRKLGTVEDVAKLVKFLLSDDATYITGQTINLNGGDIMF